VTCFQERRNVKVTSFWGASADSLLGDVLLNNKHQFWVTAVLHHTWIQATRAVYFSTSNFPSLDYRKTASNCWFLLNVSKSTYMLGTRRDRLEIEFYCSIA